MPNPIAAAHLTMHRSRRGGAEAADPTGTTVDTFRREDEWHKKSAGATVAVGERVDSLELGVRGGDLDGDGGCPVLVFAALVFQHR